MYAHARHDALDGSVRARGIGKKTAANRKVQGEKLPEDDVGGRTMVVGDAVEAEWEMVV